jgi:hypothetical protein
MDDNSDKSRESVVTKRTLAFRFADLSRTRLALLFIGLALFVWGAVPMAGALVVANRAIDDGPDPGDYELMEEWVRNLQGWRSAA